MKMWEYTKETYADKLALLIPDGVKLLNAIKFISKDKQPKVLGLLSVM